MTYWIYQHLGNLSPRRAVRGRDLRQGQGVARRRRACASRLRETGLRGSRGNPVELSPRPLRHPRDRHGLARRSRARGGTPVDLRRGGARVGLGAGRGRLRPPADRDVRPLPALARPPPSRGLERGRLRRRLGRRGGSADREAPAGGGLRPLGVLRALLPPPLPPAARGRILASGTLLPHRSSCSRATCTMPTWRRWASRAAAVSKATSTRPSARRSAIRWTSASAASYESCFAGRRRWSRARSRAPPAWPDPEIGWRFLEGPYFDNQVASLTLDGRSARIKLEKTSPGDAEERSLETSFERRLA